MSSYTTELAKWVTERPRPRRDASKVAFLAVSTDVAAARQAGYGLRTIYEHLKATGRVTSSYEAFRRHAVKHLGPARGLAAVAPPEPPPGRSTHATAQRKTKPPLTADSPKPQQPTGEQSRMSSFVFDPTPDVKDLI